jgi:orotate phosphoribosyltransferase
MPNPTADRARLFELIRTRSFGLRDVILASGKPSHFYFDMKPTMMDPEGAELIARLVLPKILEVRGDYVGGLEMGAVPLTGALLSYSFEQNTPVRGFFVRKKPKDHGAKKLIEGLGPGESLKGKRVTILEDVTTTGDSALLALEAVRAEGAEIVRVISIVDRQDGATENFAKAGVDFTAIYTASEYLSA